MFRVVILIVFVVSLIMSPNDVDVSDSTDSNFLVTFDNQCEALQMRECNLRTLLKLNF